MMKPTFPIAFRRCLLSVALVAIPLVHPHAVHAGGPLVSGCGTIAADTVWTEGNAYVLNGCALTIEAGVSLTIEPGTVVKLSGCGNQIVVDGSLVAQGTADRPVTFTSLQDDSRGSDTNGDGAASTPAATDWGHLRFNAGASGVLDHVFIGYGGIACTGYGNYSMVQVYDANVSLDHATLADSYGNGLYAENASVSVRSGNILRNGQFGGSGGLVYSSLDPDTVLEISDTVFETATPAQTAVRLGLAGHPNTIRLARNSATGTGWNGMVIAGTLERDLALEMADSVPLIVDGAVSVADGTSLTLDPGTVVKLSGCGNQIVVDGSLVADGTEGQPIAFTSLQDDSHGGDTNGDGAASSPAAADWGHLRFNAGASGVLDHVFIGYGGIACTGYGNYSMVQVYDADVRLDHATLADSYGNGLYAENASVSVRSGNILRNGNSGGTAGLFYSSLDPDTVLEISDTVFETANPAQTAARLGLAGHPNTIRLARNSAAGTGWNGMVIGGTLERDLALEVADSIPLIVEGGISVAQGTTLTLTPGTVFKPKDCGGKLLVDGSLVAPGTADEPIVFTSLQDDSHGGDSNGDGSANSPEVGDWGYIRFNAGAVGVLDEVFMGYGGMACSGYDTYAMFQAIDATVTAAHTTFDVNFGDTVYSSEARLTIHHSNFAGVVGGNPMAVHNAGSRLWVDARFNWWGDPTGPFHPSLNPAAAGRPVSDLVRFSPWVENPDTGELFGTVTVQVAGPSPVSPGETAEYVLSYSAGTDLEDAVAVLTLPFASIYAGVSEGGTYVPGANQVIWKLGDLAAGAEGNLTATVRFMWGIPTNYEGEALGIVLSHSLDNETFEYDTDSYLDYVEEKLTSEQPLTTTEIAGELAMSAELKQRHDRAIADGFLLAGGLRFSLDSGVSTTQLVFINKSGPGVRYLRRNQGDGLVVESQIDPATYHLESGNGGVTLDIAGRAWTFEGDWAERGSASSDGGAASGFTCLKNCLLQNLLSVGYLAGKISKYVDAVQQIDDCRVMILSGLTDSTGKCALALGSLAVDRVALVKDEVAIGHACVTSCAANPAGFQCTHSWIVCNPAPHEESWVSNWAGPPPDRYRTYTKLECNPSTGAVTPGIRIDCPIGTRCNARIRNKALNGEPCLAVSLEETINQTYADRQRFNRWYNRGTRAGRCRVAARSPHDPNAKYGEDGDVRPDQVLEYRITYENEGAGTAYGVYITDELDERFDVSSLQIEGPGELVTGTRTMMWSIGEVAPGGEDGSTGSVSFTVRLLPDVPAGTSIENRAVVYFPSVPEETATNWVVNVVQPVVAHPASVQTEAGAPVSITLDGDAGEAPLSFAVSEEPLHGTLSGTAPNLSYRPSPGFVGNDRFAFTATGGGTTSDAAELMIAVGPAPDDHVAPEVLWTSPADNEVVEEAAATASFSDAEGDVYAPLLLVDFSEPITIDALPAEAVVLSGPGGETMAIDLSHDPAANRLSIALRQPWRVGSYEATISQVTDLAGNPMSAGYAWGFTVNSVSDARCAGDCNGDSQVTVDELVRGVNIALGNTAMEACPAFDSNGDLGVTVDELVRAVNSALGGC